MRKALLIGMKDLVALFRDPAALSFMLAAPFVLTLGMGLITGSQFGGSSAGIGVVPVLVVNQDGGPAGAALVALLQSRDMAELIDATVMDDPAAARTLVDADKAAVAVIVPPGFTTGAMPGAPGVGHGKGDAAAAERTDATPTISVYANPNTPTGAGIVEDIVQEFCDRLQGMALGADAAAASPLGLKSTSSGAQSTGFNSLAFIAPGMALMFLMYRVTNGGGSLLVERDRGTLGRLMVSPTSAAQVLGGKLIGIYASGVAQVLILVLSSTLIFRLRWGDPLGVLLLVLAAVAGATGWGLLVAALARTPGQVTGIGATLMCIFGILGGSFVSMDAMPAWVRGVSRMTPNSWGLDGFTTLAMGGTLADIIPPIGALCAMGVLLFSVSAILLKRRGLAGL